MDIAKRFSKNCHEFFQLFEAPFENESFRKAALQSNLADLQSLVLKIDLDSLSLSGDDIDVKGLDQDELRRKITSCFPKLGLYQILSSFDLDKKVEVLTGDAIDDLLDIYNDLYEGNVHWQHGRKEDAAWHWRFNYNIHWGQHLVDLQRILHEAQET